MAQAGPTSPGAVALLAVTMLAGANIALNRLTPRRYVVPAGLAAAAGALLAARTAGASREELGLGGSSLRKGMRVGLAAGIPLGAVTALAAAFPLTRRYTRDERIATADVGEATYQLLVAIPLASAVSEEVIFRSALEGALARRHSRMVTALIGAVAFGAWHILPALDRMEASPGLDSRRTAIVRRVSVVAMVTAGTAAGGLALSWLRRRTGSVVAPTLVHYAINAGGYLGVWLASQDERRQPPSHALSGKTPVRT